MPDMRIFASCRNQLGGGRFNAVLGNAETPFEADCFKCVTKLFNKVNQLLRISFFLRFSGDFPPGMNRSIKSQRHRISPKFVFVPTRLTAKQRAFNLAQRQTCGYPK